MTPATDTLETENIVNVLNGMKLKWATYPPQFIPMLEKSKLEMEAELLRRSREPWISPYERPIHIKGEKSADVFPKDNTQQKIVSTTFYSSGRYSVQCVHVDKGAVTAMRYYRNADEGHAAGMEWMAHNGLDPVKEGV